MLFTPHAIVAAIDCVVPVDMVTGVVFAAVGVIDAVSAVI